MISHPCTATVLLPLDPFRARENKCGFITHAGQNRRFFFLFSSQKQPEGDTLGDLWSPETPGYSQTQEPQYPDSATTTGSCSDSFFSKKLLAVIYSKGHIL